MRQRELELFVNLLHIRSVAIIHRNHKVNWCGDAQYNLNQ